MSIRSCVLVAIPLVAVTQTGCVIIGGYSSRGGWFFWPGALGLLLMLLLLFFASSFLRR